MVHSPRIYRIESAAVPVRPRPLLLLMLMMMMMAPRVGVAREAPLAVCDAGPPENNAQSAARAQPSIPNSYQLVCLLAMGAQKSPSDGAVRTKIHLASSIEHGVDARCMPALMPLRSLFASMLHAKMVESFPFLVSRAAKRPRAIPSQLRYVSA